MAFTFQSLTLNQVGVIGSGQIGPDIALHMAKVLQPHGVRVVIHDISPQALERGQLKVAKKLQKGVETQAFTPAQAQAILDSMTYSNDAGALDGSELVIEAATEDASIKAAIFADVSRRCPQAVLASNSSHLEPERIFAGLNDRSRCLVIHYFFPAERNPLVEIVPGQDTSPGLVATLLGFYEAIGKVPVRVGSRFGYAVDPVFEGLFLAAALAVEAGLGSVKEVDTVAASALRLAVGPFTAMNLTGGNPITHPALSAYGERFGSWWRSPKLMHDAVRSRQPWPVAERGETVSVPPERANRIADLMRGAYFGLVGQILDTGIIDPSDYEMALEIGLDIAPPLALMNELGVAHALDLVQAYARANPGFVVPDSIYKQAARNEPWRVWHVLRRDVGDVAVVTIRRPRVLNALNEDVFAQLTEVFTAIQGDSRIRAAVLTGYGTKAFVSGADVNFLARIDSPEVGTRVSDASKVPGNLIERLGKPVVCAMNGSAIGGGLELAMCCTARVCAKGLKVAASQPEVNLGIIPGAGGTQRLPRLIGLERAAEMLRTGRGISSREAVEWGLVTQEVEGDVVAAAVNLARQLATGEPVAAHVPDVPMATHPLPAVKLGHLSTAIDALLCRAIVEGCRLPLAEGLKVESQLFGECCRTQDMKLGIENFLKNGPRSQATFVNR